MPHEIEKAREIIWEYFWQTGQIGPYLLYRRLQPEVWGGEKKENIS